MELFAHLWQLKNCDLELSDHNIDRTLRVRDEHQQEQSKDPLL